MADSARAGSAAARLGEGLYLVRSAEGADDDGRAPVAPVCPPRPSRRTFAGSGRFFAAWIAFGAVAGVGACVALSAVRGGADVVWTERSMTWLTMLFVILGALAGACCAVGVDALLGARRAPATVSPRDPGGRGPAGLSGAERGD